MTSSYYLAVDVGTSRTAAATARLTPDGSLLASPFALGRNSDSAPSAMFVTGGELLFGDAAERRGVTEPDRLVREFKRRIGDDVPILAGDQRFTPEEVYALTVAWVVDLVTEREARLPNAIAVTVPVAWGEYRMQLVEEALARHGWSSVILVTEPEAAARHYESTSPLPAGGALAVYDLGGGTFDAIVLKKDAAGTVRIAGAPVGLGDLGGSDFDDAVLRHTLAAAGVAAASLGAGERMALAALRRECIAAKESLSFDSEAVIPVLLGSGHGTVRLTRDELEAMIEGAVARTVDALAEALSSARVATSDIDSILLTGGSSRIPYIAQVLSERFDRPIAIDADPKAIIALGAVRVLSDQADAPVGVPAAAVAVASVVPAAVESDATEPAAERPAKRKWRLPAFAYLSAGTLVLGAGLVVASTTAMGAETPAARAESRSFLDDALAAGLTPGAAAPVTVPESAPVAVPAVLGSAAPDADTTTRSPAAPNVSRRSGPNAAVVPRVIVKPTAVPVAATRSTTPGATKSNMGSGAAGTTQPPAPASPTTTAPAPAAPPAAEPTQPPAPDATTEPAPEPTETPTDPPAPEPTETPTDPPAPEPDPGTDTPPADGGAEPAPPGE